MNVNTLALYFSGETFVGWVHNLYPVPTKPVKSHDQTKNGIFFCFTTRVLIFGQTIFCGEDMCECVRALLGN